MASTIPGMQAEKSSSGLTILIVDPKPQRRSILKGSLLSLDVMHNVIERGSAHGLEELFSKEPIQLIMVDGDVEAPNDALTLIQSLQHLPVAQKARFVLVSQELDEELREKASALGVKGYLSKPFDLKTLERAVREGLEMGPTPGQDEGKFTSSSVAKEPLPRVPKEILDRLKQVQVFAVFNDAELLSLLRICQIRRVRAGEYIFREGDRGDRLYVLISGKVEIRRAGAEQSEVLDTLMPGDCFGEMAIIDSGPRSAHALAAADTVVIEIKEETVNRDEDPVALKLVRQLARQLTHTIRKLMTRR
jgi:CRP/FNR family transcriptional regulator, cyclic AMP receptor protein